LAQLTRLQQFSDAFGEIEKVTKILKTTGVELKEEFLRLTEPSTKLDAVMQIINSTTEPIVIFSQFSQVIKLLEKRLVAANIAHGIIIGDTPQEHRPGIIENFQRGNLQIFAGTIAAGGIGITLTAASTVVFIDRDWSAAKNIQAEDRLHRIGQENAVHVIDIISKGTIDAKRIAKIQLQWNWIKRLLGEDDNWDDDDNDEYEW